MLRKTFPHRNQRWRGAGVSIERPIGGLLRLSGQITRIRTEIWQWKWKEVDRSKYNLEVDILTDLYGIDSKEKRKKWWLLDFCHKQLQKGKYLFHIPELKKVKLFWGDWECFGVGYFPSDIHWHMIPCSRIPKYRLTHPLTLCGCPCSLFCDLLCFTVPALLCRHVLFVFTKCSLVCLLFSLVTPTWELIWARVFHSTVSGASEGMFRAPEDHKPSSLLSTVRVLHWGPSGRQVLHNSAPPFISTQGTSKEKLVFKHVAWNG